MSENGSDAVPTRQEMGLANLAGEAPVDAIEAAERSLRRAQERLHEAEAQVPTLQSASAHPLHQCGVKAARPPPSTQCSEHTQKDLY
jgi:hypothetical protein